MTSIAIVDTETTGVDDSARMVEFGATRVMGDFDREKEYVLRDRIMGSDFVRVNPEIPIPVEAMAIHHIRDEDLVDATTSPMSAIADVLHSLGFISGEPSIMVAHNANFDRRFIDPYLMDEVSWICTYKLAVHLDQAAQKLSNAGAFYSFGLHLNSNTDWPELFTKNFHSTIADTQLTALIFLWMRSRFTIEEMIEITAAPILWTTINFGKHKGKLYSDRSVPVSYLQWVVDKADLISEDHKFSARKEIENRQVQGKLF